MYIRRLFLFAAASALMACGPARAVTQIENTHWFAYSNAISPRGSFLSVTFVARATAVDIASGVTFSLQERDPDGNDTLFDVALPWEAPYPAVGTEIRVVTDFQLECNQGFLVADFVGQWFVSWCDLDLGTQGRSGYSGIATSTGTSEPESFEFVLVDDAGVEAPGPTPEDAYHCGEGAADKAEPLVMSPYGLVQQGLSVASESAFVPRGDPGIQSEYAGAIQIAFDPAGEHSCGEIPAGTASTLYVVARAAGPTLCGITGCELRVVGIPAGWYASATIPSGAISLGDPLGSLGGNMAYSTCQSPAAGPVLLYTITVFATTAVTDHAVVVIARTPPANPFFDCPLITLCDVPVYTIVCMAGSQARINPPAGAICDDLVGVEPRTWSAVKGLYR